MDVPIKDNAMADLDNFLDVARELLMASPEGALLFERTGRILQTCRRIVELPELAHRRVDRQCLFVAAAFCQVGGTPGNPLFPVNRADLLARHVADMLTGRQIERAAQILRESSSRTTTLTEARILSDAINLDDIGALGIWREMRRHAAAGRGVAEALISWHRKAEYNYWQARIKDGLAAAGRFMDQLKAEHFAEDLAARASDSQGSE